VSAVPEALATHPQPAAAPASSRLRRWFKLLSAYFSAQALTQLLGLSAGLVLVRTMPVRQFALYTLALSVVTFFTFVSDLGSTSSLLYFFHRSGGAAAAHGAAPAAAIAMHGPGEFPLYLAAVRSLRSTAFLVGAAAVLVALPRAAAAQGFAGRDIALATAGVLVCAWFQIRSSLGVLVLRLLDRYGQSYRAEIAGGGVRLAAAGTMALTSVLYAWLAVAANGAAIALTALLARPQGDPRGSAAAAAAAAPPSRQTLAPYRRRVLRYLLPTLPSALYFSIQTPLVVWLSATFGSARNIAEVGALSRLGLALALFSNLSATVLLPRLSRIHDERHYRMRFLQFGALLAAIAAAMWLVAAAIPHLLLSVLGEHYRGLDSELGLVVASAGITLVSGYLVGVNLARSWNRWQGLAMLVYACAQAALVAWLPLGTTHGVLLFNLGSAAFGFCEQAVITAIGFVRPTLVHWE
jgi:O-antigen/teichoic acid export membrane protein